MVYADFRRKPENDTSYPVFEVISGLHRGVKLPLTNSTYRIGSSAEADIMLRDEGVIPDHAVLRIDDGMVNIETSGSAITLDDGKELPARHGYRVRLPAEFSVGDARIRVSGTSANRKGGLAGLAISTPAASAAVLVVAVSVLVIMGLLSSPTTPAKDIRTATRDIQDTTVPQNESGSVQEPDGTVDNSGRVAAITQEVQQKLQEHNLGVLTVTPVRNEIQVSGAITRSQQQAWIDVVNWFDRTHSSDATLVSIVKADKKPTRPPVALQAIWFGDNPYMIASDGKRYYEGAFLNNGWTVRAIHKDRIVLAKGDEQLSLTY